MLSIKIKAVCLTLSIASLFTLVSCSSETENTDTIEVKNFTPLINSSEESIISDYEVSEPVDEERTPDNSVNEDIPVMDSVGVGNGLPYCEHCVVLENGTIIDVSYHQFSSELIEYIGYDAFQNWTEQYSDPEDLNIVNYIKDNNVPREYIDEINTLYGSVYYYYDYNTDALYSDNAEEYYTSDRVKETLMRAYLLNFKSGLWSQIRDSAGYEEWVIAKADITKNIEDSPFNGDMRRWSISEVISYFDISRDVITDLADRASKSTMGVCEIDVDMLYNVVNSNEEISVVDRIDTEITSEGNILNEEELVSFDVSKFNESNDILAEGYEFN